jgi:hypothetical protein
VPAHRTLPERLVVEADQLHAPAARHIVQQPPTTPRPGKPTRHSDGLVTMYRQTYERLGNDAMPLADREVPLSYAQKRRAEEGELYAAADDGLPQLAARERPPPAA